MATKPLPELTGIPNAKSPAKTCAPEALERWLNQSELADWVNPWVNHLKQRHKESLPEFFMQGLNGCDEIPQWMTKNRPEPTWLMQFLSGSDMALTWLGKGFLRDDPQWLEQLVRMESAGITRSFLLSGNIGDYAFDPVVGYRPISRLLIHRLQAIKDCVLVFSLSQGLTLHEKDGKIRQHLPECLERRLNQSGWNNSTPLLSTVCSLFDEINNWLLPTKASDSKIADCAQFTKGVAIVFENVHLIIRADNTDLERSFLIDNLLRWSNSPELFRSSHCLVLTAETINDVNNDLRARGGRIESVIIARPSLAEERLKFLIPILDPRSDMRETRTAQSVNGIGEFAGYEGNYENRLNLLAHDTAGLTLMGIEDLLKQASASPKSSLSRAMVMGLKRERLRQDSDGLLEVLDPTMSMDAIGGYTELKTRIREVVLALKNANDPLVRASIPMGVLFLGPPGTGKSVMATAMAGESGVSMAKLGNFRGMYVGQSERNLARIFALIESLYPVIVFIDEIDQALGARSTGGNGDGGVDNRIFGQFLEFISQPDHRGKILWVGASNFPQKIDPAMKRAGRFDLIIPFLLPEADSRAAIFSVMLTNAVTKIKDIQHALSQPDFVTLAEKTDGFSGAEIEAIVNEVLRRVATIRAEYKSTPVIDLAFFSKVLDVYQPPAERRKAYRDMELLAIEEVCFRDLLPMRYQSARNNSVAQT